MKQVKLEIYTPESCRDELIYRLTEAGACQVGNYTYVSCYSPVEGTWMPGEGSDPYEGEIGKLCRAAEYRLETRCPYEKVKAALAVVREVHPYEEPVVNILPLLNEEFDFV